MDHISVGRLLRHRQGTRLSFVLKSRKRTPGGKGPPIRLSSVAYAAHVAASREDLLKSFEEEGILRRWDGAKAKWAKALEMESSFPQA